MHAGMPMDAVDRMDLLTYIDVCIHEVTYARDRAPEGTGDAGAGSGVVMLTRGTIDSIF